MIISRTPYRVSFFGGGTDYPSWYRQHGGAVLATSIDKYCYLTCRYLPPFFEHRIRVVYSKIELCRKRSEIKHPVVREALQLLEVNRGVEIHHDGDLPARSGMGSSSAFTVGLLHALHALQGQIVSKQQLATQAINLEQNCIKETVGSQDQVTAAYGGLNHVVFSTSGHISVQPVTIAAHRQEELNSYLMLFFTGISRTAQEVAASYVNDISQRKQQLRIMNTLVEEALALLAGNDDLIGFGELLHEAWQTKRTWSGSVSNRQVDETYEQALSAGAIGGKLLGAGGGGFILLLVPPDKQPQVQQKLSHLIHVPFKFESVGSQIVLFDPEQQYATDTPADVEPPEPRLKIGLPKSKAA